MAFNNDQNEPSVPISNVENRETSNLLPKYYRTKGNKKFLQGTLDQLTQPGTVKKVAGYIGRKSSKATSSADIFLEAKDTDRQHYQLEPAAVVKDYLGNTTFFKDYLDHINHIEVFGGEVADHKRINRQEFYSWNPHIDWDKFANFQQYFWLPFGPEPITVFGQQQAINSEYTVRGVDEEDNVAYLFTPNGLTRNPTLRLFRGQTYIFNIDVPGHPFSIKTQRVAGTLDRYLVGVGGVAVEKGQIIFTVPPNAPDVLYYVSEEAVDTGGVFHILDIEENTFLDLDLDILGKKNYAIPNINTNNNAVKLSNGMKLKFGGQVSPEKYSTGYWYVEGVGTAIKLLRERSLEVRSSYAEDQVLLFDDVPFDQLPFSETSAFPSRQDYITINRSSIDNNPWSRYNRWFHKDVIETSAVANGKLAEFNQSSRAVRPIIEFNPNIKLHNYGIVAKQEIDVIDNYTKDAFSIVEGSLGYIVDGISLANGMRIIFNADTDVLVKNKIYRVNFIQVQPPGRQLSFDAATAISTANSVITFNQAHQLNNSDKVIYFQNGNIQISGLVNRQRYYVKILDIFNIELYKDSELTKKVEIFSIGDGTHIFEVAQDRRRQIQLTEEEDSVPNIYDCVSIKFGTNDNVVNNIKGNQGQNYWFNGTNWVLCQVKTSTNQFPLFDIFDEEEYSYSDPEKYVGSNFSGNKIFSYKIGSGIKDQYLGFPLSYKNINNVGDILFEFNLLNDSFSYKIEFSSLTKNTDVGYLKISNSLEDCVFKNGWTTSSVKDTQPIVRVFQNSGLTNAFPIDVFTNNRDLENLEVRAYVNGKQVNKEDVFVSLVSPKNVIVFSNDVTLTDVVTLKYYTNKEKNDVGYYEIPINLQNNPLNENVKEFTLGQVIDHVDSIVGNIEGFMGSYPGNNNLRDLGNVTQYGTRFVQHSAPLNLSLYHFGSKSANIIKALDQARNDYSKFKRSFLIAATDSGIDLDPKRHVDYILQKLSAEKPKTQAYYLSDMFGYTAFNKIDLIVLDPRTRTYPITEAFNLTSCSNRAINIYLNDVHLIHGRDYTFGENEFFIIDDRVELLEDDVIEVYEYNSTDGCYCPPTPSKLGLYPKYEPKIYIDDSYIEPTEVILGHDGSITLSFGDFRDELLLELEKRIYNNIKISYNPDLFDIYDYIPGYNRITDYSTEEYNGILSKYFFQWTQNIIQDYTKPTYYDRFNSFTWNYRDNYTPDNKATPASWKGIYRWLFDTTTPHLTPWECLGFSVEPKWWEGTYGPAPYTSDNFVLWNDIKDGRIKEPNKPDKIHLKFARPILQYGKPVGSNGELLSPYDSGLVTGIFKPNDDGYFLFGDEAMVESAWRRSSYYSFAVIQTLLLMHPSELMGRCFDRSRIFKNLDNQLVYSDTNLRIKLSDIKLPSTVNDLSRTYTAGLVNYVVEYLSNERTIQINKYATELTNLTNNISTRLGGFTNKSKFKLILDSKTPSSNGGVFIPDENYFVDLNVSSPIKKINYSGVIITKFADGFELKGYNFDNPYFEYYSYGANDRTIQVGGISESYVTWEANRIYTAGKIVLVGKQFYRAKVTHNSGDSFDEDLYIKIPELPLVGGKEAILRKAWDTSRVNRFAYGTKLSTVQEVVDIIQGYGAYLESQGFIFDDFNSNASLIANWELSIREFLFWCAQGWAEGSVISLSPSANRLMFNSNLAVVDNLIDTFYGYSVLKADGQKLNPELITVYRSASQFILEPENTNNGIYGVTLYLVQKEHIVVLDDSTVFNDTVYDKPAGYRQEKIKVLGYLTSKWNGSFEVPGFIYDRAVVNDWQQWTDYNLGDIIRYKEFYYSAKKFLPGTETLRNTDWLLLDKRPESELLPNWDYRAEQFTDFYDLDTDNFDIEQQRLAQHLTGYQKRQYLENIINNDVSQYKFYQGMITEKGTQNVLNKLFDVLSAKDAESLTFDEEWAVRVGEYGALDTFKEIEFKLDESEFKINPQPLELVDFVNPNAIDFVYRQRPSDVYIKPIGLSKDVWAKKFMPSYLRTPGYVRKENVRINVDSLSNLSNVDISSFIEGDYIWAAFDTSIVNEKSEFWNIYRLTTSEYKIEDVTYNSATNVVTIECDKNVNYVPGQSIGINGSDSLKGFHVISSVSLNKISFVKKLTGFNEFTDNGTIIFYIINLQRVSSIDSANSIIPKLVKKNELLWADNNGKDLWTVYQNYPKYSRASVFGLVPEVSLNVGTSVSITDSGNIMAVSDSKEVVVYLKGSADNNWQASHVIDPPERDLTGTIFSVNNFGSTIKFSRDGTILVIAASMATNTLVNQGYIQICRRTLQGTYQIVEEFFGDIPDRQLGKVIDIGKYNDTYVIAVSANSAVYTIVNNETSWVLNNTLTSGVVDDNFGYDIAISDNLLTLIVSATASPNGKVYVYDYLNNQHVLNSNIITSPVFESDDINFGHAIAISSSGSHIAVGLNLKNQGFILDVGQVYVYQFNGSSYGTEPYQIIDSRYQESNERFGTEIQFMNDSSTLLIYSQDSNYNFYSVFEDSETSFDNNSTIFSDVYVNLGRVDVYDRYNVNFIYGETLEAPSLQYTGYGNQVAAGGNTILVAAKLDDNNGVENTGIVYSYKKPTDTFSWMPLHEQSVRVDISTIKKAFLYNTETNQLITYLDVVDPTQGKIPGIADQEIKFKSYYDPAVYSIGTTEVVVDDGESWTDRQVGMLWWDLNRAKFLDNESGDVVYKTSTWNKLYDTASIDIYEWVSSSVLPASWDELSITEDGITAGYSGTSKYGNSVYSIKRRYDNVSQKFINRYYFWVKNKLTIPNIEGRHLKATDVANLIANPTGYGYSCLAFTDSNSVALVNMQKYLESEKVALSIQYWVSDFRNSNYHSQWKLISTNKNTSIPSIIEEKWFHSLVGKDNSDRLVPDISLPIKQRYGIEYRPRQGMFINRIEALKQYIERVNSVLRNVLITDTYNLSNLKKFDVEPSIVSSKWDLKIDTDSELRFVPTSQLRTALVTPIVIDGSVTGINISNPGKGYGRLLPYNPNNDIEVTTWYGPDIIIKGQGINAKLKSIIDNNGSVVDCVVLDSGEGYNANTTSTIRSYAVLVSNEASSNGWAIFTRNINESKWEKTKFQSYNVNRYWEYIDWYASGYNEFVKIDFLLHNTYELTVTEIPIGNVVKIRNIGSGGWVLVEKYDNIETIDYTKNYRVIGRQNGTIQFLDSLYKSTQGYDNRLLDSTGYDIYTTEDLRIILDTVKNDLLVDDLKVEYLKLFFASLRYALHEQLFVDWAMKTSFVKAMHNLGDLKQKPTYNNDNLEFFEEYIKEVKPYRTKVREYISNYTELDPTQTAVTDFDLLPVLSSDFRVYPLTVSVNENNEIQTSFSEIASSPWNYWFDNVGFEITSIKIVDAGEGYVFPPIIKIQGNQLSSGTPAKAKAYISKGRITRIELLNPGSKWVSAPTVIIDGSTLPDGHPGRAITIIGNNPIRSSLIKMKFDRLSKTYQVTNLDEIETFSGAVQVSGSRTQFPLRWSPDIRFDKYTVVINGAEVLKSEYKLTTVTKFVDENTKYSGLLTFKEAPAARSNITIRYSKNFDHLAAVDRINFFYNPQSGQLGKDLSQLMIGVDYGGVTITGIGLENNYGWDAHPWFSEVWDATSPDFEDYIVIVSNPISYSFRLPYVPEEEQTINIYVSKYQVFDENTISQIEVLRESTATKLVRLTTQDAHNLIVNQLITLSDNDDSETYRVGFVKSQYQVDVEIDIDSTLESGWVLNTGRYLPVIRIDDPAYGVSSLGQWNQSQVYVAGTVITADSLYVCTVSHTSSDNFSVDVSAGKWRLYNTSAIMSSFVGDGEIDLITLPTEIALAIDDKIIFRKKDSDGSINPKEDSYDTTLLGGDLAYQTATGFAPDDIILDGDDLISSTNSHAPEEVVPGQVMDTLAIKVYSRPAGGSPNILFKNYYGDGVTTDFLIGQQFPNNASVIVKIGDEVKSLDTDFTIDWQNNLIKILIAPAAGIEIGIISLSFNSANMLDLDYFVSDGETLEYITRAPWLSTVNVTVLVNGITVPYEIFPTNSSYVDQPESWRSRVGIAFPVAPPIGSVINYIIDSSDVTQTASVVKSETFIYSSYSNVYNLTNQVGISLPLEPNILVKNQNVILIPPSYTYFTLSNNQLEYELLDSKYQSSLLNFDDIKVYLDGRLLTFATDYTVQLNFSKSIYSSVPSSYVLGGGQGYAAEDIVEISGGTLYDSAIKFEVSSTYPLGNGARFDIAKSTIDNSYTFTNTIVSIVASGSSYSIGDIINISGNLLGGVESVNDLSFVVDAVTALGGVSSISSLSITGTSVASVGNYSNRASRTQSGRGAINQIELISTGLYLEPPELPLIVTGGSGSGATLVCDFEIVQDLSSFVVVLNSKNYVEGSKLTVGVTVDADYEMISPTQIEFKQSLPHLTPVEIISFYNHNVLGIERTVETFDQDVILSQTSPEYYNFQGMLGGLFKLRSTVSSGNFVWIVKNGELLINNTDYVLEDDYQTIRLTEYLTESDIIQVIVFSNTVVNDSFGYMQFKDIMNRVHYKRLNKDKSTNLTISLGQFDRTIVVDNPDALDDPNISLNVPGIIEINGERIEYFTKDGNELGQLRRGTLGTGIPISHISTSIVQGLGVSETIPYKDEYIVEKVTSDGIESNITLPYVPNSNDIEVFVGGLRLKKNEYTLYTNSEYPYSPEGDTILPKEFIINGAGILQLTTVPPAGVRIVVVKKQGRLWNDLGKRLANSNNSIANFIKAADTVWPDPAYRS